MGQDDTMWKVVGGSARGGIIVRGGRDTSCLEVTERLCTGSIVLELERHADRLHYELLTGKGPKAGWVSISMRGKDLLVAAEEGDVLGKSPFMELWDTDGDHLQFYRALGTGVMEYCNGELVVPRLCKLIVDPHTGICDDGEGSFVIPAVERSSTLKSLESFFVAAGASWECCETQQLDRCKETNPDTCFSDSESEGTTHLPEGFLEEPDICESWVESDEDTDCALEDSDGERIPLCRHCHLPLGQAAGQDALDRKFSLHAECEIQRALRNHRRDQDERIRKEAFLKKLVRDEYDIGWKTDRIPRNIGALKKLGCGTEMQGMMCCLRLQTNSENEPRSVSVAATKEPSASLILEYLSLALQVRRDDHRAPLFSLDLVEPSSESSMQAKRVEPEWLAGTSAGELLFQADIFLKELCMGEHTQPVEGMKSCLDYVDEEGSDAPWNARVWFVVRKAEVHISTDNVLVPRVELGVEAREQCLGPSGMEDVPITRPDHPAVRYAQCFERNLDLIAERKSVIFNLRELTKAVCLAKFLINSGIELEECWFDLDDAQTSAVCMEVPQVWNTRFFTEAGNPAGTLTARHISGGVDLDMEVTSVRRQTMSSASNCRTASSGSLHFYTETIPACRSRGLVPVCPARVCPARVCHRMPRVGRAAHMMKMYGSSVSNKD